MTVGERIKEIREEKGLSQEELAKRLGLKNKSSVCKIEKSGNKVSAPSIYRYAEALGTTVARIMGWSDNDFQTEDSYRVEREGMDIYIEEEKKIGSEGIALRIAMYHMKISEIKKMYDIAKVMYPEAFEKGGEDA